MNNTDILLQNEETDSNENMKSGKKGKEEGKISFFGFESGFYALSASKAIFRARTYNCITYSVR